jgi:hypothetical protein
LRDAGKLLLARHPTLLACRAFPAPRASHIDPVRETACSESVVDIHHADTRRARIQHRQQGS